MTASLTQTQNQSKILDLIVTILVYKFPHLNRAEIENMIHIPDIHLDISTTQFYKDIFAEGKLEGKQETVLALLQHRFGQINSNLLEKINDMDLKQLDVLLNKIFDFKQIEDLSSWLRHTIS